MVDDNKNDEQGQSGEALSAESDEGKSEKIAMMSFNMPIEWHTEFKITAARCGLSMKELFTESFEAWKSIDEFNKWRNSRN